MGFHLVFPQTRSAELKENGCVDSSSLGEKGLSDMTQNQDFHTFSVFKNKKRANHHFPYFKSCNSD